MAIILELIGFVIFAGFLIYGAFTFFTKNLKTTKGTKRK